MKGFLDELGVGVEVQVNTDSSAAQGIASGRGAGRVRHIEVTESGASCEGQADHREGEGGEERGGRFDQARGKAQY